MATDTVQIINNNRSSYTAVGTNITRKYRENGPKQHKKEETYQGDIKGRWAIKQILRISSTSRIGLP
ncbi:hypothetical protein RDI58_022454 [Solanum bulbocastanum]|uniref:Uncharacterized protein n=1 Tax=Solanum bulbocastanum TaxID=147425 RepID=A0AAN8T442_SOLBU